MGSGFRSESAIQTFVCSGTSNVFANSPNCEPLRRRAFRSSVSSRPFQNLNLHKPWTSSRNLQSSSHERRPMVAIRSQFLEIRTSGGLQLRGEIIWDRVFFKCFLKLLEPQLSFCKFATGGPLKWVRVLLEFLISLEFFGAWLSFKLGQICHREFV